jgi:hypothetical protein
MFIVGKGAEKRHRVRPSKKVPNDIRTAVGSHQDRVGGNMLRHRQDRDDHGVVRSVFGLAKGGHRVGFPPERIRRRRLTQLKSFVVERTFSVQDNLAHRQTGFPGSVWTGQEDGLVPVRDRQLRVGKRAPRSPFFEAVTEALLIEVNGLLGRGILFARVVFAPSRFGDDALGLAEDYLPLAVREGPGVFPVVRVAHGTYRRKTGVVL